MCQPPVYGDGTGRVCRLHKAAPVRATRALQCPCVEILSPTQACLPNRSTTLAPTRCAQLTHQLRCLHSILCMQYTHRGKGSHAQTLTLETGV